MATAQDTRQLAKDLLRLLGWPALLVAIFLYWMEPWKPHRHDEATAGFFMDRVSGVWDLEGGSSFCQANPHRISFSPDHRLMLLTFRHEPDSAVLRQRVFVYDISSSTDSGIVAMLRGETRRTAQGAPVEWELILTTEDSYAWRQTDWPPASHTPDRARCPSGTDSLIPQPE